MSITLRGLSIPFDGGRPKGKERKKEAKVHTGKGRKEAGLRRRMRETRGKEWCEEERTEVRMASLSYPLILLRPHRRTRGRKKTESK